MKRPYREGDWFVVPLGDGTFAAGIVTQGTRKAIYGSFFGPARNEIPQLADLIGFDPGDALWSGRFSDRAIVEKRWPVVGSQPAFVRERRRTAPGAPAAGPGLMERRLAALASGVAFAPARISVRGVRSPIEPSALDGAPDGVSVHWRDPLTCDDLDVVGAVVSARSGASVRLTGNAVSQIGALAGWRGLQRLRLEAARFPEAPARLPFVRDLELDGVPTDLARTLERFPHLRALRIRARGGTANASALARASGLDVLVLRDVTLTAAASLRDLRSLRVLDIESATLDEPNVAFELPLTELRLAAVAPIVTIAALHDHPTLRTLSLGGLIEVNDLRPIATIARLESLDLRGFWQCAVEDVAFVDSIASLLRLYVDIGGRRKNLEIYRRRPRAEPLPTGADDGEGMRGAE